MVTIFQAVTAINHCDKLLKEMIDYPFPDVFISKLDAFPENIF